MTDRAEREVNWEAVRVRAVAELEGADVDAVRVVGWKYPEGELIIVGNGLDLLRGKLGQLLAFVPVEIRVRLDETGRIEGVRR